MGSPDALGLAIREGNVDEVRKLIAKLPDVDAPIGEGNPALYVAAWAAQPLVVAALLEAGADPNQPSEIGLRPLHACLKNSQSEVRARKPEVLGLLLCAGADPSAKAKTGTPLHFAKVMEEWECADLLEQWGANPESDDLPKLLWQCSSCGGVLQRPNALAGLSKTGATIAGTATCSFCGSEHQAASVYGGTFDFADTDQGVEEVLGAGAVFDSGLRRWRLGDNILMLQSDTPSVEGGVGRTPASVQFPLHAAVKARNITLVRSLINEGCDSKMTDENGLTARALGSQLLREAEALLEPFDSPTEDPDLVELELLEIIDELDKTDRSAEPKKWWKIW
jgi:hypothetical protein